jgi:hypothetical protein
MNVYNMVCKWIGACVCAYIVVWGHIYGSMRKHIRVLRLYQGPIKALLRLINQNQPVWLGCLLVRIEPYCSLQDGVEGHLSYFVAFLSANKQTNKDFIFVTFKHIVCSKEEKVLATFFFSLLTGRKRISNDVCVYVWYNIIIVYYYYKTPSFPVMCVCQGSSRDYSDQSCGHL